MISKRRAAAGSHALGGWLTVWLSECQFLQSELLLSKVIASAFFGMISSEVYNPS